MAPLSNEVNVKLIPLFILCILSVEVVVANWCVARSDASDKALQLALDFACASGADCTPMEQSGLCFLPNTLAAHASYAFNSYFQLRAQAPASCNFSGTATIAKTDPSYGSCVYPASMRTAGGAISSGGITGGGTTPTTTPTLTPTMPPPPPSPGATYQSYPPGGLTPGTGQIPDPPNSIASFQFSILNTLVPVLLVVVTTDAFQLMM